MRRGAALALVVVASALPTPAPALAAPPPTSPYVVVLRAGAEPPATAEHRLALTPSLRFDTALRGFAVRLTPVQLDLVRRDPSVAYVQPDAAIAGVGAAAAPPPPPPPPAEVVPPGVRRIGAAAGQTATTPVAVLDTGIDLAATDLAVTSGTNCIRPGTTAADDNGHGTHVAGTIAARANGAGVVGVAPATRVFAVKVLDRSKLGSLSQLLCGLDWLARSGPGLGIRVANMSISAPGGDDGACGAIDNDALHKAVCSVAAAGIVLVASAGNAKADLVRTAPASYREVLAVTAMSDTDGLPGAKGPVPACVNGEADDRYAAYSNFAVSTAAAAHTVSAPGTCVLSTKSGGGTALYYGTSQAAPHAAGVVASCVGRGGVAGACAGLTPAAIIERVVTTAQAAATTTDGFLGDPVRPISGKVFGPLVRYGT